MATVGGDARISAGVSSSPRVKARMLEQMAEALEDEVSGLYRRAAAFEEEESLLNKEIGERQTEINTLLVKLDAMRAERDRVIEKIELVSHESALMRDRAISCEEDGADGRPDAASTGSVFFRRMMVA